MLLPVLPGPGAAGSHRKLSPSQRGVEGEKVAFEMKWCLPAVPGSLGRERGAGSAAGVPGGPALEEDGGGTAWGERGVGWVRGLGQSGEV